MSDALDDLRAHEAEAEVAPDFAARQRAATRALVSEYSAGRGPGVEAGLASADRALALIDAATEPSKPAAQPKISFPFGVVQPDTGSVTMKKAPSSVPPEKR